MRTTNNKLCENYQFEDFLRDGGFAMFDKIYMQYNRACQTEKEDCYQEYSLAAAKAIRNYNPHRVDVKLFTFVWYYVENQAKMICRSEMAQKRANNTHAVQQDMLDHYFEIESSNDDWDYPELMSYERICRDETTYQVEERDSVSRIIQAIKNAGLSDLEKTIIIDSINGFTQQEIADHHKYSQSRISKYKNDARRKLRIYMEVMG